MHAQFTGYVGLGLKFNPLSYFIYASHSLLLLYSLSDRQTTKQTDTDKHTNKQRQTQFSRPVRRAI